MTPKGTLLNDESRLGARFVAVEVESAFIAYSVLTGQNVNRSSGKTGQTCPIADDSLGPAKLGLREKSPTPGRATMGDVLRQQLEHSIRESLLEAGNGSRKS